MPSIVLPVTTTSPVQMIGISVSIAGGAPKQGGIQLLATAANVKIGRNAMASKSWWFLLLLFAGVAAIVLIEMVL